MATQEAVEMFTLFNVGYNRQEKPATVTAAIGPRLAAFGSPEAFEGGGAVALYSYYPEQNAWGYVGVLQGSHMAASNAVRGLGSSITIAGDTLVIGAKGDASAPGRVVIANPPYGVWTYGSMPSLAFLTAPKPTKDDGFGTSVACCYDGQEWYVAVGSPNTEPPIGPYGTGAAFVYRGLETSSAPWSGNWGTNPVEGAESSVGFGSAVAITPGLDAEGRPNGTVVLAVGAPGAGDGQGIVYVGHTTNPGEWPGRWTYAQTIEPKFPDYIDEDFRTAEFGSSVALAAGSILAVGSPADPNFEKEIEGTGAVWIYTRGEESFELAQEGGSLYGDDAEAQFGRSIAFPSLTAHGGEIPDGAGYLVVGSPGQRTAFLYSTEDGATFTEQASFAPFAGKAGDGFGQAVGITITDSGPWCVVGAPGDNAAQIDGGGYLFAPGEEGMKWLSSPATFTDPMMRWMSAPLEHFQKVTPDPYDYYR